ncbi:flagellar brake protein [Niallia sp. 01092]|uniref:flagellar brake protein n=1 Tax=unclassified Niallia TaxID=2837522 RepID=UPI003FD5EE85
MIKIGDTLILEPVNTDSSDQYKCKLVETSEKELYIDYPIHLETNKTAFLLNGTQLKVNFVTNEGAVFMFQTEILGRKKENVPMLILHMPSKEQLIKIQRRQFVRVDASLDIAVHPLNNDFPPFTTVTTDISAGGAALIVPKTSYLQEGAALELYMVLHLQNGEYYYPRLKGTVIRVWEHNETHNKVSLQFFDVSPSDRQFILRFCYDVQLSFKKKGLEN